MISNQSTTIANREILLAKEKELLDQYTEENIKRPDWW